MPISPRGTPGNWPEHKCELLCVLRYIRTAQRRSDLENKWGKTMGKKRRKKIGLGGMVKRRLKKETWNNLKSEISHSFSNVEQSQTSCFLLFLRRDICTCWRNFETAYSSSAEDQNLHVKQRCWPMGRLFQSIAWCPFSWDWHTQKKLWTGGWDKLWNFAVCTRLAECVIIYRCSVKMSG